MQLRKPLVDLRNSECQGGLVPKPHGSEIEPQARKKKPDERVAKILSAIDVRRQKLGIRTLEELTRLARGLSQDETPDNASTWHGWRDGTTTPKFVDLADFARAVGLTVGLVGDSTASSKTGAANTVSAKTREIAALVEQLDDDGKAAVLAYAETYRKMWGTAANPRVAADDAGHALNRHR